MLREERGGGVVCVCVGGGLGGEIEKCAKQNELSILKARLVNIKVHL